MRGSWRLRQLRESWLARVRAVQARMRVASFPTVRARTSHGLSGQLVVSLTSYPPRFPTLALTLRSLLDQTVLADRTILWVSAADRLALPPEVNALVELGLEIRECPDWKSYKKLIPSILEFPDAHIVTADDDLYYGPDWLAALVAESHEWPGCIVSHRAHLAKRAPSGEFRPYRDWQLDTHERSSLSDQAVLFPTGCAGILYPPRSLDPLVTDERLFTRLCPDADDVWFFWMAMIAGTRRRRTEHRRPLICWRGTQDVGLVHRNLWGGGNDEQIKAMQRHFSK